MCVINSVELRFFKSLVSIPVVNTTLHLGTNLYCNIKHWNPYLETTLSATEQMAIYVASTSTMKSVVNNMEKPVIFIDGLAADGLQMLESKYPSIRMTPQDLKEEAHKQMIVLRGIGATKFRLMMKSICRQNRQRLAYIYDLLEASVSPKIAIYVDIIEKSVEDYLPLENESTDMMVMDVADRQRVFARLAFIPNKVQQRLVKRYNQLILRITWTESSPQSPAESAPESAPESVPESAQQSTQQSAQETVSECEHQIN